MRLRRYRSEGRNSSKQARFKRKPPMMRLNFEKVIQELALLTILREFDPCIIGTPPLGIEIDSSDIDVACSANDLSDFERPRRPPLASSISFDAAILRCRTTTR